MENAVRAVPETLRLLANSPALFQQQTNLIGYYRSHKNLSPDLLTLIRYSASCWYRNVPCMEFNAVMLKKQGITDEELSTIISDPTTAPLEEREKLMLKFVMNGIKDQNSATEESMKNLRSHGWLNSDIVDAVNLGFLMFSSGKIVQLFKMI